MRILWVCNKCPMPIANMIKLSENSLGGWLDDMCSALIGRDDVDFSIVFKHSRDMSGTKNGVYYAAFANDEAFDFGNVLDVVKPDIIHIWGTEYCHSYYMIEAAGKRNMAERCVISIQGLVSIYGQYHYTEGLPMRVIKRKMPRDWLWPSDILTGRKKYLDRGKLEKKAIEACPNIIGRTDWDRAVSGQYNPGRRYFSCNESLRNAFYNNAWNIDNVNRHSIFVSQCAYPVKGFHYMLEAFATVLKLYPDAAIYTTGKNLLTLSLKEKLKLNSYEAYLLQLIRKNHLEGHVHFLGHLSEEEMCSAYLKAHVFVSPSTIENSSNSIGEAMCLGCPIVSSDVGGVKNMMEHGKEGFIYQSSAPYMCAYYICRIFGDDELAKRFSGSSIAQARGIFDREKNFRDLMDIYQEISGMPAPTLDGRSPLRSTTEAD